MVRQANLGTQVSGLGYTDASMLGQVGQQQQGQTQANLDVAQKDWQAQNDYQKQNLDWLSQITRGLQAQPTAYGSTAINPTQYNTLSPLAAAWQGFSGSKSLMSPTTATPTQQATR
jgi:hypothetical protein